MGQRDIARKHNINNTTEGCNNRDLSLTHILPHDQLRFIIRILEV